MKKERAKELLPIIVAYINGKTIEYNDGDNIGWVKWDEPDFELGGDFRIKNNKYES